MNWKACFKTVVLLSNIALLPTVSAQNRVAFGSFAVPNQFPYQVSLRIQGVHKCGGAIIGSSKVITAAHCVTTKSGGNLSEKHLEILAGVIDIEKTSPDDGAFLTKVKSINVHSNYKSRTINNDVAVLITQEKFDFSGPNLATIPLSKSTQIPADTECVISGWGKTETTEAPDILKYAKVIITPRKSCMLQMKPTRITNEMICAIGPNMEDAQVGDSGGPLVCNGELAGIISFGKSGSIGAYPGIYTRVGSFEEWIQHAGGNVARSQGAVLFVAGLVCILPRLL